MADTETNYSKLVKAIEEAPITWLPALLGHIVRQCHRKKVFRIHGLETVVKQIIEKETNEKR